MHSLITSIHFIRGMHMYTLNIKRDLFSPVYHHKKTDYDINSDEATGHFKTKSS